LPFCAVKHSNPLKKRKPVVRILRGIFFAHLGFWVIIAIFCVIYSFVDPPLTPLMLQRHLIRGYDWHKRENISLENIPPSTVRMVIAIEDANYYKHFGFEWNMIKQAWRRNQEAGKIRFGASTISNQVARTIFLTTDRNWVRKYLEAQVTVLMEVIMSKDRMLELYLNYVEWGQGIFGIETASQYYYGKSCAKISRDQSMRLIAVLSNPIDYSPHTLNKSRSARQRYQMLKRYF
jgi:monofunctional biosynthetic peptidoglycan transglycosylase